MKRFSCHFAGEGHQGGLSAGHTLIEMMFSMSILVVLVLALLSAQWIGMQQEQLVASKAGASDSSRRTLNQLPAEIPFHAGSIFGDESFGLFHGVFSSAA